ncbi:MAG TPA: phosphoribosylformylglycinamidine synthase subunit PurL [Candidatus Acidoferrum sp.]|nr:phosphoribosylformylglycinamidine synthase subunit PurL [Candidatus Acidoferrum sp.]
MTLNAVDLKLIENELGRPPNEVESAIFENLWSEHCAYRSSKPLLKTLPTTGDIVLVGPGDDAAVILLKDDFVLAIAMESHNHPSYVDPYDGAATGVGGIVRDVISMGAKPIALMDDLYFGYPDKEKNRYLFEHVVEGIADYGNCIGVPVVNGEVVFDSSYDGNPLVNVVCIGMARKKDIITGRVKKPGNRIILMGAMTGRDGLGGASFASRDLSEDSEAVDRPSVQIGDPFTEKLLIDATLEAIETGHVLSCRDLGAAGLAGASSEMCATFGAKLVLDEMPLRETGMTPMEILVSESQERMVLEVPTEHINTILQIADKYDLQASVIGEVIDEPRYIVEYHGETVADIPIKFLTEEAPICQREAVEVMPKQASGDRKTFALKELALKILSSPNIASREWVYRQFDHEVQTRTVVKPGNGAAVLAIDGMFGIAVSSGCNPKHSTVDPYKGAALAVFENAMNLAVKGAQPMAFVNCLNFGNPENQEVYWQLKRSVEGLSYAARILDVPVVGGNVSLYNESEEFHTAITPTTSIGMVGTVRDVSRAPHIGFSSEEDFVIIVGETRSEFGGSEYYSTLNIFDTAPEPLQNVKRTVDTIVHLIETGLVSAANDVSNGGLIASLAEMCVTFGARIDVSNYLKSDVELFAESCGRAIITVQRRNLDRAERILKDAQVKYAMVGVVTGTKLIINTGLQELKLSAHELKRALNSLTAVMR